MRKADIRVTKDADGKIIIRKSWDRLTQEACMAYNDGMTYGKWKGLQ